MLAKKEDGVEGTFTFYFLLMTIHKNSSQYWIVKDVKDGVSCIYPIDRLDWHFSVLQYCSIIAFLYWKN